MRPAYPAMQEPQTRLTPPLRRTPPGQERGNPPSSFRERSGSSVSMPSFYYFDASTATPDPSIRPNQAFLERLPGPHLTRSSHAFSLDAHHDSLRLTQLQGGLTPTPAGPTPEGQNLHLLHSTAFQSPRLHRFSPSAFVTHHGVVVAVPSNHARQPLPLVGDRADAGAASARS